MNKKKPLTTARLKIKAQEIFRKFIRERDKDKPCVSCGKYVALQCGHFYSGGHYSQLYFDEDNSNGQCLRCNYHLSGNLIPYRIELLKRIGKERVEMLDMKANHKGFNKNDRFKYLDIIERYK